MPELPEVETIKRDLNKSIKGKKILEILYCDTKNLIKEPSFKEFEREIKNKEIKEIKRRAKNLLFYLSSDKVLLIHLKLTGHLLLVDSKYKIKNSKWTGDNLPEELKDPRNQFIHLSFLLSDGNQLALSDLRKFAAIRLIDKESLANYLSEYGPEPLEKDFTFEKFKEAIKNRKGPIKKILMDQSVIAGIGNIYSDEILFESGILPARDVKDLSEKELKRIYNSISNVLKKAIKLRGESISDFRDIKGRLGRFDRERFVYRREGKPCKKCGTIIERIKIGGRSAHFCPKCQK